MLLHIIRLEAAPARHLSAALPLASARSVILPDPVRWRVLPMVGLASLDSTEEVENGVRTVTTKITATLAAPLPFPTPHPLAFRLTTADGLQFLLGKSQAPFPLITQQTALGGKHSEMTATSLTISLKAEIFRIS